MDCRTFISQFSSIGRRQTFEDRIFHYGFIIDKMSVHVGGIADGHAGNDVAQTLQSLLPLKIRKEFKQLFNECNCVDGFTFENVKVIGKKVIEEIEQELLQEYKDTQNLSGSTLCFYILWNLQVVTFQVGDSFIFIFDKNGNDLKCVFETQPHCKSNKKEHDRVIENGGFFYHSHACGLLQPTRVIGDFEQKECHPKIIISEPEVEFLKVSETSIIVVGCDGVSDVLSSDNILQKCKEFISLPQEEAFIKKASVASSIGIEALEKKSTDNVSVLVEWIRYIY